MGKSNLVVAADKIHDISRCIGQHSDSAALYESGQRVVDVHLLLGNGEDHVNPLLGQLLRQLTDGRIVLR